MSFAEDVYKVVQSIPKGKVMTYGQVARAVGRPRAARYVGYALHQNQDPNVTPCHRVVFRDGSLSKGYAFGGEGVQMERLKKEGVMFAGDKVDLAASGMN